MPIDNDASLDTLREIRDMMNRSSKFMSLSGWSGIWAGTVGLCGAAAACAFINKDYVAPAPPGLPSTAFFDALTIRLIGLALAVFIAAFAGGLLFTYNKSRRLKQKIWNSASRQMATQFLFPLVAGAVFSVVFIYRGMGIFVVPACLAFYGLAVISGSRHTLSEIRYLGIMEVALGCICLFVPQYGLYFWAIGFGVLHIVYGIAMWNKYETKRT